MKIEVKTTEPLSLEMAHQVALAEVAVTRGIAATSNKIKGAWRDEVRRALGPKLANAIRSRVYPDREPSMDAAGLVYARPGKGRKGGAAEILSSHENGAVIRSADGFWLAIPTEEAGRARRGKRLTPGEWEQRTGMRLQFVYRSGGPSFLVATGRLYKDRLGKGRMLKSGLYGKGSVTSVIFLLVPQVRLRKRLNLMSKADRLANELPQAIVRNWPR